jgi:hypothetical protein
MAYVSQFNNKTKAKYKCLAVVWVVFIIPMLFLWYPIHFYYRSLAFEIPYGIK